MAIKIKVPMSLEITSTLVPEPIDYCSPDWSKSIPKQIEHQYQYTPQARCRLKIGSLILYLYLTIGDQRVVGRVHPCNWSEATIDQHLHLSLKGKVCSKRSWTFSANHWFFAKEVSYNPFPLLQEPSEQPTVGKQMQRHCLYNRFQQYNSTHREKHWSYTSSK